MICPELTLCGRQDIKLKSSSLLYLTGMTMFVSVSRFCPLMKLKLLITSVEFDGNNRGYSHTQ